MRRTMPDVAPAVKHLFMTVILKRPHPRPRWNLFIRQSRAAQLMLAYRLPSLINAWRIIQAIEGSRRTFEFLLKP